MSLVDFIVIAGEAVKGSTETNAAVSLREEVHKHFLHGRNKSTIFDNAASLPSPFEG